MAGKAETGPAGSPDRDGGLFERDRELAALDRAIVDASAGAGSIVMLTGPAGIGKSRLVAEARAAATRAGFTVLSARGGELEREYPFGIVRQLFELRVAAADHARAWLDGPAYAAAPAFSLDDHAGEGGAPFAVLHGLYWLVVNACDAGPLLLTIDDLQWSDAASLRFLTYLASRLDGLPLLLLAALRPPEFEAGAGPVAPLLTALGTVATETIRPAPLSASAVTRLVGSGLRAEPDASFASACQYATGGNPLLVTELLRALRADGVAPDAANTPMIATIGPLAVAHGVLLRLARLSSDAIEVARSVAILGDGPAFSAVAALAGLGQDALTSAVDTLVRAEIFGPGPTLAFVHPLVRDAVYQDLTPGDRQRRHARAAQVLRETDAPEPRVAVQVLALEPRRQAWVVDVLRAASRTALNGGAADSAVAYLRRALREPPDPAERPGLLYELGVAESLVDVPAAIEHLSAVYADPRDPGQRVAIADLLARLLLFSRPAREAADAARAGALEAPPELHDERLMLRALERYAVHFGAPDDGPADRLDEAVPALTDGGLGARSLLAVSAWDRAMSAAAPQSVDVARAALSGDVLIRADPALMSLVAVSVLILADREEAAAVCERMLASARRQGSLFALTGIHQCQGWNWLARGELAEAEDCLRQAMDDEETLHESSWNPGTPYARAFFARVLLEQGKTDRARRAIAAAGSPAPGSDADALCRRVRIEVQLAQSRYRQAIEAADEYAAALGRIVNPAWAPWRSLKARALIALDRRDPATALLEEELALARTWGAPGTLGATLRWLGIARGHGAGLDILEEAVRVTAGTPALLEHAKSQATFGTALHQAGHAVDARAPLRGALELAARCGSGSLVEEARLELLAAGGRPYARPRLGPSTLSPSERRVVDLAAAGGSNRDIAQALFITTKTVEAHLSHAYRKLGIHARAELAGALGGPTA